MTTPVLYTFPISVWASVPQLAAAELGVDVDLETIDLFHGENFNPKFLANNPNGTLPALAHNGKSYISTAEVVNYLVSISSKKVAPATSITTVVHEEKVDPNFAFVASKNDEEFAQVSNGIGGAFTANRLAGLRKHAASPEGQPYKEFYDRQIAKVSSLDGLFKGQAPDEGKQKFFEASTSLWENIKIFVVETLPGAINEGPFIGGATPGVDDYHVGGWFARIAFLCGAKKSEEGVAALEKRFGPLPDKVKKYWAEWIARESWVKAYPDNNLH
ncbi:hypothetical protein V8E53_014891 [Lactarius tabidus]